LKIGDTVAVFGTGPIGLLVIQSAREAGASKIIAVEVSPERQEFAKKVGADIVINPLEKDAV
jgi:(R,R)-butanediol dehydrogenase / meso-butanediol dehydrogenase / diacetyl reductase